MPSAVRGADEDVAQVPRRAGFARKSFGRGRRALRLVGVIGQFFVQPVQQRVQFGEDFAALGGANALRKIADRRIGLRQAGIAQKQARPEPLDGAAHDAVGVLRLDLAVGFDAEFVAAGRRRKTRG